MSEENVELTRELLGRLNALDRTNPASLEPEQAFGELWQRIDPEAELHGRADVPDARSYRGPEGFRDFLQELSEAFSEVRWEPQEFIDHDDAVVVVGKVVAIGRGSEVPVEMDETDVVWFRDGKIVCVEGFATREQGLAAAETG
jgi:ketosteroid isomerase-like protein